MIITRTPHRISFFGGGTDYPDYYLQHGGKVLGTAIDRYCYLNVRKLPPFFSHKHRVVYSQQENVRTIDEIEHPAVREILRYMNPGYGVSVHHDGDIPARSGMGSSSAFTAGLLKGMLALEGKRISASDLTQKAIYIEQEVIKENVGSQDQTFAAYGGFNTIEFKQNGQISVQPMLIREKRKVQLEKNLMLFFTGISRFSSDIAEEQVKNTSRNIEVLDKMKNLVDTAADLLCSDDPLDQFGELLHDTWLFKKSLSNRVSNSEINDIYEKARKAGAVGGKILGAGGGGFVLFYVPEDKQPAVKRALNKYLHVPFCFEYEGSKVIVYQPIHEGKVDFIN
ncbi:kinase [Lentisphaerota bacterium ZTH]|nr:kinase [Lentisphaerota bacterium]WET05144.1 kinase [Lentisphaerota bacterium ZTH]